MPAEDVNGKTTIIIFGASGDLAHRKLIPALYSQFKKERLPSEFNVVGISRTDFAHDVYRENSRKGVEEFAADTYAKKDWDEFAKHLWYISADASQAGDFKKIQSELKKIEGDEAHHLYYLSVSPTLYETIITNLGIAHMAKQDDTAWRRIIIEKPFGTNLATAQALNRVVHSVFDESQVYRIDHYLGKETAQNILFFRFANTIFEPVWNRNYIDSVQITAAETVDVGSRAAYYDHSGVLRDMFQNHITQLLTLMAMEPPSSFEATALRNEKLKLIQSIRPVHPEAVVVGQYEGYRSAEGVSAASTTPTFAAMRLNIDNWRWQGVPFYLRSGKALKDKVTKILIEFKAPPHMMFNLKEGDRFARNILSLCIQPDEGIHLQFDAKIPGANGFRQVDMDFHYRDAFTEKISDAYERLIVDAIRGDAALFMRNDEIEAAWTLFDPVIGLTEGKNARDPLLYRRGAWGPDEADNLLDRDGHRWRKSGCLHDGAKNG